MGDAGLPDAEARHVEAEHAALAMIRLCAQYPDEVTLVCLGPLTTVALACRLDPSFPSNVKEMLIMGGTIRSKGNVTLTGEFNWHKDPEAVHIVLSSFAKSTMVRGMLAPSPCMPRAHSPLSSTTPAHGQVSWETTEEHTVAWDVMDEFLSQAEQSCSTLGTFLRAVATPFIRDRERWTGALICDAVAMAVALDPSIVTESVDRFVDVELQGTYGRGMSVIDWEGMLKDKEPNVRIITRVDMAKFHAMLLRIVETATHAKAAVAAAQPGDQKK